jgi:hypothetical protein
MFRPRKPPSPTWRAFLGNHVKDLAYVDFFVLAHARRRFVRFNVTEHLTAQ